MYQRGITTIYICMQCICIMFGKNMKWPKISLKNEMFVCANDSYRAKCSSVQRQNLAFRKGCLENNAVTLSVARAHPLEREQKKLKSERRYPIHRANPKPNRMSHENPPLSLSKADSQRMGTAGMSMHEFAWVWFAPGSLAGVVRPTKLKSVWLEPKLAFKVSPEVVLSTRTHKPPIASY